MGSDEPHNRRCTRGGLSNLLPFALGIFVTLLGVFATSRPSDDPKMFLDLELHTPLPAVPVIPVSGPEPPPDHDKGQVTLTNHMGHVGPGRRAHVPKGVILTMNTKEGLVAGTGATEADLDYIFPEPGDGQNWSAVHAGEHLPKNGMVAIVVRGQAFRTRILSTLNRLRGTQRASPTAHECHPDGRITQLHNAQTLLDKVVVPLEARGNAVHVFLGPSVPQCGMMPEIHAILGESRVLASKGFQSSGQAASVRHSARLFIDTVGGPDQVAKYNLVFHTRFDVDWQIPIDRWRTPGFSGLNMFSRCMTGDDAASCVTDIIQIMPGTLFPRWAAVASKCYDFQGSRTMSKVKGDSKGPPDNGHSCYRPAVKEFGPGKVHLITRAWIKDYVDSIVNICNGCAKEENAFTCNQHHQQLWTCRW
mmetsp:Transcript_92239/g.263553  ORF Transcript_92239/g.263553 Transcript_92239/m.263553 type:complete len:419 (+) Transcript_92239:218-1474(+)|eukprot:CAMPEP_0119480834 /NCGR_PEP_ID=MMETSP1344-20130328/9461_1 /TAXON_ID=236787 /ORGANISM="Florenciella parvula, Strain CCMP2471" /LENGTH=418 /DNA_ID=CAMNT_0007515177 /DNA_START=210 /DNA_END=1466 /DNA_ORIENTATION=+